MSTSTSRRRNALRAAIAAGAIAGAFLAPAATAFADSPPVAAVPAGTAVDGTLVRTDQLKGGLTARIYRHDATTEVYFTAVVLKDEKELGTLTAGAGKAAEESRVFEGVLVTLSGAGEVTSVSDAGSDGQGPETPAGVLVHKDTLKGGLRAEVYRYVVKGKAGYSADIFSGTKVLGSLMAGQGHGKETTKLFGEVSVTLFSDGRITSAFDHGSDGQGPETPVKCVATIERSIGAGIQALLTITPSGPSVIFRDAADGKVIAQLGRTHPKLPASAGFVGEILAPNSHSPQLRTNMEGGGHPATVNDFPELPKGCSFTYGNTSDGEDASGGNDPQTTVVPKGSVAAGAETPQGGGRMLVASAGGAAALGAAGVGFVVLRRRAGAAGR